ncbi:MAG: hypothetical protein ACOC4J_02535 [Bacteroidota bacterium]
MKYAFLFCLFVFFYSLDVLGQPKYIGLEKDEIIEMMKEDKPDFSKAKVINKAYNYLKYQDSFGEQTILFFLNDNNVCTSVKIMSHYVFLGEEVGKLNEQFHQEEENLWTHSEDGEEYTMELEKGQWFFSVITKKKD